MAQRKAESDKTIAGGLTQVEIDKLKARHGKLTLISVSDGEDGEHHLWFKKPSMDVIKAASSQVNSSPIDSAQIFWKNCLVKGDNTLVDDVEIFTSVAPLLNELVEERTTEVKNF